MAPQEFATAYSSFYYNTTKFLLSRGISPALAEEVAQAAWTRGWERRDALREDSKIGAWVNTIALNILRRKMRSGKREVGLNPNIETAVTTASAERLDANKMLETLSKEDRRMLLMQIAEGRTSKEIGCTLGLSAVAVRVRLCRARARLRCKFAERPLKRRPIAVPQSETQDLTGGCQTAGIAA